MGAADLPFTMLHGHGSAESYGAQLDAFKKSDAARVTFIDGLIRNYEQLAVKYAQKCDDYNNEVESRRMWQTKYSVHEQALTKQKQISGSNSFVIAVIDGDGAIFQDFLYALGKDGGVDAAHQLHAEIKAHLKSTYEDTNIDDWSIVVQVIMNMHGLASRLIACGIISHPNDLPEFGRAFSLAQPLFSFIDVGSGKERADYKVRETLRLFLPNAHCKHVFFGPCSDNGYLPVLESYRHDYAARLTLIETRPAALGFAELGLPRVRFPRVFRSDNLPCKPNSLSGMPTSPPMATSLAPPSRLVSEAQMQPQSAPFIPKNTSPAPSSDSGTSPSTWATVGKSGTTAKTINIAPNRKAPTRRFILINVYDERLDPDLPRCDPSAEKRFAERLKTNGKFCNTFHLMGKCETGDYCDYNHGTRLSPGEQLVLKHKARSRSCPKRSACRDLDCTFGHQCKFAAKGCLTDNCWFMETHGMDMEPAKRVYHDGTEEWIQAYLDKYRP